MPIGRFAAAVAAALLLSSTGLAFRRCSLVRINGDQIGLKFGEGQPRGKKRASSAVEPATTSEA